MSVRRHLVRYPAHLDLPSLLANQPTVHLLPALAGSDPKPSKVAVETGGTQPVLLFSPCDPSQLTNTVLLEPGEGRAGGKAKGAAAAAAAGAGGAAQAQGAQAQAQAPPPAPALAPASAPAPAPAPTPASAQGVFVGALPMVEVRLVALDWKRYNDQRNAKKKRGGGVAGRAKVAQPEIVEKNLVVPWGGMTSAARLEHAARVAPLPARGEPRAEVAQDARPAREGEDNTVDALAVEKAELAAEKAARKAERENEKKLKRGQAAKTVMFEEDATPSSKRQKKEEREEE